LLLVVFLLAHTPNCHLSLVLASVVQGDAVNCNKCQRQHHLQRNSKIWKALSLPYSTMDVRRLSFYVARFDTSILQSRFDTSILQSRISSYNCLPSTSELYADPKLSQIGFRFLQSGPSQRPWRSVRKSNLDRQR